MEEVKNTNTVKELIEHAANIAVMPAKVAGFDAFAAGAGLFHALKEAEKKVSLVYPGKQPEGVDALIRPEEVTSEIDGRELVVSIEYSDIPGAKVKYDNSTPGLLYLRLSPVSKEFDIPRNVRAGIRGYDYDLIFTIGAPVLRDLGRIYNDLESELTSATIVNFDITNMNHRYGAINIVDSSEDSLSLLVLNNLQTMGLSAKPKSAKALLSGITHKELR